MSEELPARTATVRLDWPDAAKGIGILLVVLGHVMGGLIDSNLPTGPWPLRETFLGIYVFHMPLFFLLSGLFVKRRIETDRAGFVLGIFRNLYYPYLIWSFVQLAVIHLAGAWTNTAPGPFWIQAVLIPIVPVSQFWFLLVLAVMHLLTLLLLPRVGPIGLLVTALVMRSISDVLVPPGMLLNGTLCFYTFYVTGLVLGTTGVGRMLGDRSALRDAVGLALALGWLYLTCLALIDITPASLFYHSNPGLPAPFIASIAGRAMSIGAAFAMTAAIIVVASRARGLAVAALTYLGRTSLPIYILHVMFAAGTRIVAVKLLHVTSIGALLAMLLLAGIAGPLILRSVLDRLHLSRRLGLA